LWTWRCKRAARTTSPSSWPGIASGLIASGQHLDCLSLIRDADAVAEQLGVRVDTVYAAKSRVLARLRSVLKLDDGKESAKSLAEVISVTRAKAEGLVKGMSRVGTWRSRDSRTFYLALGVHVDSKGAPVVDEEE
jgi:hypothetical protein